MIGVKRSFEVHACSDCRGCPFRSKCLYQYDEVRNKDKNKVMKANESWEELKRESHGSIQSEKGILNRQIRSIQTEGHFRDIKENDKFRRFSYRSSDKVYKEFMLYSFGRNLNKDHRFKQGEVEEFEGKTAEKRLKGKCLDVLCIPFLVCPKLKELVQKQTRQIS